MIREKIILDIISGKHVLDIGSIGQTSRYSLWELYKTVSVKSLTGIDLPEAKQIAVDRFQIDENNLPDDVRIVYGNMETYRFERRFDVIVAGDVIEHVHNQGLFLNNIRTHLADDGIFILTTPNTKWPTAYIRGNPTHVLWHDRSTLTEILRVCGFTVDLFRSYCGNKKYYHPLFIPFIAGQQLLMVCSKS
jgi:2-polyprenyl-3-methyl-5-hydroxy-6-metoxy-1,4-benzoquinol methylase